MLEINKIYNEDCLLGMQKIPSKSIDCIICDLPYGTQKSNGCKWDVVIPFDKLWEQYNRIIKDDGAIVLFSKEPFTSVLIMSNIECFKYRWNWEKDTKSKFLQANYQPLNNCEDICVFSNAYAREIKDKPKMKYNPQFTKGDSYKVPKVSKTTDIFALNHKNGKFEHSDRDTSLRYPFITLKFNIDKPKLHPTQKPVELLRYLVRTYTNVGDLVLDNCMGSGTTAIACLKEKRNFVGFELNKDFYEMACNRIETERQQPTLF